MTPADVHDTKGARCLLAGLAFFVPRLKKIWADAAYRGQDLAEWCHATGEWELEVVERASGTRGFSIVALISLLLAILPNLPGFLVTVKIVDAGSVPAFFVTLYSYAWFVGFAIAFCLYLALRKLTSEGRSLKGLSS